MAQSSLLHPPLTKSSPLKRNAQFVCPCQGFCFGNSTWRFELFPLVPVRAQLQAAETRTNSASPKSAFCSVCSHSGRGCCCCCCFRLSGTGNSALSAWCVVQERAADSTGGEERPLKSLLLTLVSRINVMRLN